MESLLQYNCRSNTPATGHSFEHVADEQPISSDITSTEGHAAEDIADFYGGLETTDCGSLLERFDLYRPDAWTEGSSPGRSTQASRTRIRGRRTSWEAAASATVDGADWSCLFVPRPGHRNSWAFRLSTATFAAVTTSLTRSLSEAKGLHTAHQ
jgi:hypothetical protein